MKYKTLNQERDFDNQVVSLLNYSGLVLLAFELIKDHIVVPIKSFYEDTIFSQSSPFATYEKDVLSRDKKEFMACLLYLRDFMEAIDGNDLALIQELRDKRNLVAHRLTTLMDSFDVAEFTKLLVKSKDVLFELSNYRVRMEIGADPEFQGRGINWETIASDEYFLFTRVLREIEGLSERLTS